jgi:hypothetical protein
MKKAAGKIVSQYISNDSTKSGKKTLADEKKPLKPYWRMQKKDEFLATNESRMGQGQTTLKPMIGNTNAVIPDNQFRKRNPIFADSELYNEHKEKRKKTRKDKAKTNAATPSSEFTVNLETNTCICPAGKELLFLGDHFDEVRGTYSRF